MLTIAQYVVDNCVKIESGRLKWIKEHQSDIRAKLYQGLQDALHVGETNVGTNSYNINIQFLINN